LQPLVLAVQVVVQRRQMLLDLERLMKHRLGIVVGLPGALVSPHRAHADGDEENDAGVEPDDRVVLRELIRYLHRTLLLAPGDAGMRHGGEAHATSVDAVVI
jgi:hypothetical protein